MKLSIMLTRFPFGNSENPDVADWYAELYHALKSSKDFHDVARVRIDDTPITASRNRVVEIAKREKMDYLLMLDSDMKPDAYLKGNPYRLHADPAAKPFFGSSLAFMLKQSEPCVVAAPYSGPPPIESTYVFEWKSFEDDQPTAKWKLAMIERERSARSSGFEWVPALPTGLILIDMRIFNKMQPPYFYYEYTDETESVRASTEDVVFTRDVTFSGQKCYVNWDAWAGHHKRKCVGKPRILTSDDVSAKYKHAINIPPMNERRVDLRPGEKPFEQEEIVAAKKVHTPKPRGYLVERPSAVMPDTMPPQLRSVADVVGREEKVELIGPPMQRLRMPADPVATGLGVPTQLPKMPDVRHLAEQDVLPPGGRMRADEPVVVRESKAPEDENGMPPLPHS